MRRLFGPHTLLLATVAACSSFAGQEGRVDSGFDASTDASSEASDDAPGSGDAGRDALADAGTDQCVLFDGPQRPPGWNTNVTGGTVSFAPFNERKAFEARVSKMGDSAQLLRDLTIPAGGRFKVTVDLHTSAASSIAIGWFVKLVTITCTAPDSVLQFYSSPERALYAEIFPPASGNGSAMLAKAPPSSWSTLELDVADDEIKVRFASIPATLKIRATESYAKLPRCQIAVGAAAEGSVAATTVHVARVCVAY